MSLVTLKKFNLSHLLIKDVSPVRCGPTTKVSPVKVSGWFPVTNIVCGFFLVNPRPDCGANGPGEDPAHVEMKQQVQ